MSTVDRFFRRLIALDATDVQGAQILQADCHAWRKEDHEGRIRREFAGSRTLVSQLDCFSQDMTTVRNIEKRARAIAEA